MLLAIQVCIKRYCEYLGALAVVLFLRSGKPKSQRMLAIYKPDGIGDFVLSAGAIELLLNQYGAGNVTLFVAPNVVELVRAVFPGTNVESVTPGYRGWFHKLSNLWFLRRAINSAHFEVLVCLRHYRSMHDAIVLRSLRAKNGFLLLNQSHFPGASDRLFQLPRFTLLSPSNNTDLGSSVCRELVFHSKVLNSAPLLKMVKPEDLRTRWRHRDLCPQQSFNDVVLSPFGGSDIRSVPVLLARAALAEASRHGIVAAKLTGTKQQRQRLLEYAAYLRSHFPSWRFEVFTPNDIMLLIEAIAGSKLVLSAETSVAHIATALDKPLVTLLGGGHYGWFAPWRRTHRQVWLTNSLPCFGCNWRCIYSQPLCITGINVDDITVAVRRLLGRGIMQ